MYNLFLVLKTMLISKVAGVSTFPSTLFSEIVSYVCNTASWFVGFPGSSDGKESACNAGDPGLTLGSGSSPGEGHGNPIQCSCLENSMDRGAWQVTVLGVTKSRTRLRD